MTEETNELMENARALLAAATPGEWAQCMEESPDGCYGISPPNPTSERGREQARHDAALIAFAVSNLPALLDALAAEKQRADEVEAGAAAWRQHTAALVAAMKTWGSWEDGVPCESDGGEYGEVGAAFNAAHDALHPGGNFASWRCSSCGETATMKDSSWRWNGTAWQHTHADSPQAGHFDAVYADPARALLARMHAAEADAAALPAMDAECARLRAQVDADRQTIVRLTNERDRALAAAVSSAVDARIAADLLAKVGENAYAWPYGVAWACKEAHRLLTGGPPDGLYVRAQADNPRDLDAEVVAGVQASRTTPEPKP